MWLMPTSVKDSGVQVTQLGGGAATYVDQEVRKGANRADVERTFTREWGLTASVTLNGAFSKSLGGKGQAKLSGTGRIRLIWTPDYEGEADPTHVNVIWTADAISIARPVAEGETQDAYTNKATRGTVSVSASALVAGSKSVGRPFYGQSYDESYVSTSRLLGRYKVLKGMVESEDGNYQERSYVLGPLVTLAAEANISGGRGVETTDYNGIVYSKPFLGEVSAMASASGDLDPRELWLLRQGAGLPKIKGGKDEFGTPVPLDEKHDEWRELNSDGQWVTHGHSRWSYTNRADDGSPLDAAGNPTGYLEQSIVFRQLIGAFLTSGWGSYSEQKGVWSPLDANHDRYPPGTVNQIGGHSHIEELPDGGALLDEVGLDKTGHEGGLTVRTVQPTG